MNFTFTFRFFVFFAVASFGLCFVCLTAVGDDALDDDAPWILNMTYGIAEKHQRPVTQPAPPFSMPEITSHGTAVTSAVS